MDIIFIGLAELLCDSHISLGSKIKGAVRWDLLIIYLSWAIRHVKEKTLLFYCAYRHDEGTSALVAAQF